MWSSPAWLRGQGKIEKEKKFFLFFFFYENQKKNSLFLSFLFH